MKNGIFCEAILDWPHGKELCNEPAVFEVERVAQAGLTVCAKHLGPILQSLCEYPREVCRRGARTSVAQTWDPAAVSPWPGQRMTSCRRALPYRL